MDSAKVETELAKIISVNRVLADETAKLAVETVKLNRLLTDETARLTAETVKLNREPLLYPIIVSAFCIGALLAILKFLL